MSDSLQIFMSGKMQKCQNKVFLYDTRVLPRNSSLVVLRHFSKPEDQTKSLLAYSQDNLTFYHANILPLHPTMILPIHF